MPGMPGMLNLAKIYHDLSSVTRMLVARIASVSAPTGVSDTRMTMPAAEASGRRALPHSDTPPPLIITPNEVDIIVDATAKSADTTLRALKAEGAYILCHRLNLYCRCCPVLPFDRGRLRQALPVHLPTGRAFSETLQVHRIRPMNGC